METSDAARPFYRGSDHGVLREHEAGVKTAELCPKHGISDATFYNWNAKYGGMTVSEGGAVVDAGGREPAAEEAAGGVDARRVGVEGFAGKKLTRSLDRYTVADAYLLVFRICGRGPVLGFNVTRDFSNWAARAWRMAARPAVQRAFGRKGLTLPTEA